MSQGFTQVFPYYCTHMITVRVSNDISVLISNAIFQESLT